MNAPSDFIEITRLPLRFDRVLAEIGIENDSTNAGGADDREIGAVVTFSGVVREREGDAKVRQLDYEHYDAMAENEMRRLIAEARDRWPLRRVALVHRVGPVAVGEASVIVAVAAGHRAEAFEAARYLIDELKRSVPIWKSAPE